MKLIIAILFSMLSAFAYAKTDKVNGAGMNGYFVYEDGNGNQIVKHPTVPSVAYDLNGKKIEVSANSDYKKIGTVKSDGSIIPISANGNELSSGIFFGVALIILLAALFGTWKVRKKLAIKKEETMALARMKANIYSDANSLFIKFHKNSRPSQIDYISENTTDNFFNSIKDKIANASDFKDINVKSLKSNVESVVSENGVFVANVNFKSTLEDTENEQTKEIIADENWKFQFVNDKWLLAETRELAPTFTKEKFASQEQKMNIEKEMATGKKYSL